MPGREWAAPPGPLLIADPAAHGEGREVGKAKLDGQLAQLAALVAHGNEWLAGNMSRPSTVAAGSTFQYVNEVSFTLTTGRIMKRTITAEDPNAWLQGCAQRGVTTLWLDPRTTDPGPMPGHLAAAFANGTRSSILALGPKPQRWVAAWTVGRSGAPDNRIWNVIYVGSPDRNGLSTGPDLDTAHKRLVDAVSAARDLANRFGWTDWARWFAEAMAMGDSSVPRARFHDDAVPASADLPRRQLFALASGSYVFGGMGSWNDLLAPDPQGEAEYERVSSDLYTAVLQAVAAAVNPTTVQ